MTEMIERREQITPAWLSATLAAAGFKVTVVDIEVEPIVLGYSPGRASGWTGSAEP